MSTELTIGSRFNKRARSRVLGRFAPPRLSDGLALLLLGVGVLALVWLVALPRAPQAVDLGSSYSRAYVRGFYPPQRDQRFSYMFTGEQAEIALPGVGGGWMVATLRVDASRPAGVAPAVVRLTTGAVRLAFRPLPTLRTYHLLAASEHGDLRLHLVVNPFQARERVPRQLGIPIDSITVQPLTILPALVMSAQAALLTLGTFLLLRRLGWGPGLSLALTAAALAALGAGLFTARLLITVALTRWLVVLTLTHALLCLAPLLRWLYTRAGVPLLPWEEAWLWRIVCGATLLKLGGMLYPHAIIFDEAAHVLRMHWILEGRFLELYRPGYTSYMGDTVGLEGGQLPYSPLWYLIVTPFHFLGLDLGDATNGLSALMDVSKTFLIHIIGRVTLARARPALLAAALYHLIPMPYFMLSWGNYPTQFGLWASLLTTAFLVTRWHALHGWRTFLLWSALLALSILSYTVLGVVNASFLLLIGLLALIQQRGAGWRRLRFIVAGLLAAELFCFAIYHVQFARVMVVETLPALIDGLSERLNRPLTAQAEARDNALANFSANNQFTVNHFTPLALMAALPGYALLFVRARRWWPLWAAWLGMFVVYSLFSGFVADMVLKHVFFIMPLVCIALAVVLERWWRAGPAGRLAALAIGLFLAAEVIERGHFYLLVKRHFV